MRLYDNSYERSYEEINRFYPVWYGDVLEMNALWHSLSEQMDGVKNKIIGCVDNCFVRTADEETLVRLEKFLRIDYDSERTIQDRRSLILSFFTGNGHIGEKEIRKIVSVFTQSPCKVAFKNGIVTIQITRDISDSFLLTDCYYILQKKIPAHLNLSIQIDSAFMSNVYVGSILTSYKEEVLV